MKVLSILLSLVVLIIGLTVGQDAQACEYCNKAAAAYKGAGALPSNAPIVMPSVGGSAAIGGGGGAGGIRGNIVVKPSGFSNNFFASTNAPEIAEQSGGRGRGLRNSVDSDITESSGVYQ